MSKKAEHKTKSKGLETELHPALRSSNLNLLRSKRQNPYLDDSTNAVSRNKQHKGLFQFFAPGEVIKQAEQLRKQKAEELELQQKESERKASEEKERRLQIAAGELPDDDEVCYINEISSTPIIEWWDKKYLKDAQYKEIHKKYSISYENIQDESEDEYEDDDEEEDRPSIRFVKHPLPIKTTVLSSASAVPKVYLTKMEQRKIRRNQRKIIRQEKEEKVRLGLEPKPTPKVKLSNMMHTFENDNSLQDPTKWEQLVKQQVDARNKKHLQMNEQRHQEAKAKKAAAQQTLKQQEGNVCRIYRFTTLQNPKIRYKISVNAKQLHLKGCCLHIQEGLGIIITIGTEKSSKFFQKLVTSRIQWTETFTNKQTNETIKCPNAKCELVWEGILGDHRFRGWFMKPCRDRQELTDILSKSGNETFSHIPLKLPDEV
ncbi:U4/U6-U5 snRNP complex subunit PRP3 Ecym_5592 [Eremothecium cymbalariae DBVPG|uniref:Uncharacterized protein n=1 Tax=Eremothecium cymbalariae (strain CBS 270.75 / DBVPG 7215 / KCTC 17166 / NRRL Y-17582) TaxID=931890 RepID=I6NE37_ERECY|nr:hypothetical protein Ecym_5592 [Eremothecium cymbalariae DBVPG\